MTEDPSKRERLPLSVTHPELASEAVGWDPKTITYGSVKKLEWRCPKGHIYLSTPNMRTSNNHGCPYCSGRRPIVGETDLQSTHPELASQSVNWNPSEVSAGSHLIKKWKCSKSHIWEAEVKSRALGNHGCPYCWGTKVLDGFNDLATTNPIIASEAIGWDPKTFSAGSNKIMEWRCNLGHIYLARIADRADKNSQCPFCTRFKVLSGFNA